MYIYMTCVVLNTRSDVQRSLPDSRKVPHSYLPPIFPGRVFDAPGPLVAPVEVTEILQKLDVTSI